MFQDGAAKRHRADSAGRASRVQRAGGVHRTLTRGRQLL